MSFLPQRPLRVRSGYILKSYFWAAVLFAAGLAISGAYLVWQWNAAARIRQDQDVWDRGVAAIDGNVSGRRTTRNFIFKEYNLDVSYTDPAGGRHSDHYSFDTLFGGVDDNTQPQIHVDPTNPNRYAISWAIECTSSRWTSFGFMAVIGTLIGLGVMVIGWAMLDRARLAKELARDGVELECALLSTTEQYVNGKPSGSLIYRVVVPPLPPEPSPGPGYREPAAVAATNAGPVERDFILRKKDGGPFVTTRGANQKVLVIVSRANPKRFMIVREDFFPFVLDEAEKSAAEAQIRNAA